MPLPTTLNYTNKEYASIREELLKQVGIITKGRYTNLNESDPGIALIELYMSMVDNLLFYQDMMIQELYLSTARQRRNVINLVRLIGYEFRGSTAATGNLSVVITPGTYPIYPVTILKGTQFSATGLTTNKQVIFTTTADGALSSASDVKLLPVIQGIGAQDIFTATGTASFKVKLTSSTVEKTSIVVKLDISNTGYTLAELWTPVDSFYETTNISTVYKVEVDEYSQVSIIFGNGVFGRSPSLNTKIYVDYVVTNGSDGNVGPNNITTVISGYPLIYDRANNQAQITIRMSTATSGGQDTETIEEAKEAAVGQLFSQKRALTKEDFKFITEALANVDKAIAWGEAEEQAPDYRLMNLVRLTFFSQQFSDMYYNPASMSSYKGLRDRLVKPTLLNKIPITTKLNFIDPVIVDIFMWIQIGVNTAVYDPTLVSDNVKTAIIDTYSFDNVTFGQDIRVSDIYRRAAAVPGVSWVKINRLHTTPSKINSVVYNNTLLVDSAPIPPIDIILENWKLPTVTDISINPNFISVTIPESPYLEINLPLTSNIGINDIMVTNPDTQSDIDANAFTCYPSSDIQHIIVTYSEDYNGPSGPGGFYGLPAGLNDSYIFSSAS
jgi:hypothetical protein